LEKNTKKTYNVPRQIKGVKAETPQGNDKKRVRKKKRGKGTGGRNQGPRDTGLKNSKVQLLSPPEKTTRLEPPNKPIGQMKGTKPTEEGIGGKIHLTVKRPKKEKIKIPGPGPEG